MKKSSLIGLLLVAVGLLAMFYVIYPPEIRSEGSEVVQTVLPVAPPAVPVVLEPSYGYVP